MALDLYEELLALTAAFEQAGIPYAVCGGLAVAIHGAPRFTKDLDVLIRPDDVTRAKELAKTLGFTAESLPMKFRGTGVMHRVIKFGEAGEILSLDLLVVGEQLEPAWETREAHESRGRHLWVVSRPGLISMKLAAGRPQDLVDVQRLSEST